MPVRSVKFLKSLVDVVWWLTLSFTIIVTLIITFKTVFNGNIDWSIPVHVKKVDAFPSIPAISADYQYNGISAVEAVLKLKVKRTLLSVTVMMVSFACTMFLFLAIFFHLRKIMRSVRTGAPFILENIRRLRLVGLLVILTAVVKLLCNLYDMQLLQHNFPSAGRIYWVKVTLELWTLFAGIALFALAEIFKKGYQLKTDNESFV